MKFYQFRLAVQQKNFDFEIQEENEMIGFTYGKHVWHWFYYNFDLNASTYLHFAHSYSQNTGKVKKSFNQGWKIKQSLLKNLQNAETYFITEAVVNDVLNRALNGHSMLACEEAEEITRHAFKNAEHDEQLLDALLDVRATERRNEGKETDLYNALRSVSSALDSFLNSNIDLIEATDENEETVVSLNSNGRQDQTAQTEEQSAAEKDDVKKLDFSYVRRNYTIDRDQTLTNEETEQHVRAWLDKVIPGEELHRIRVIAKIIERSFAWADEDLYAVSTLEELRAECESFPWYDQLTQLEVMNALCMHQAAHMQLALREEKLEELQLEDAVEAAVESMSAANEDAFAADADQTEEETDLATACKARIENEEIVEFTNDETDIVAVYYRKALGSRMMYFIELNATVHATYSTFKAFKRNFNQLVQEYKLREYAEV